MPPANGHFLNSSLLLAATGSKLLYKCNDFYVPITHEVSVCNETGLWDPTPSLHNCTLSTSSHEFQEPMTSYSSSSLRSHINTGKLNSLIQLWFYHLSAHVKRQKTATSVSHS